MPELDDSSDDMAALADEQQRQEQAEEKEETATADGEATAAAVGSSRAAPAKSSRRATNSNPRDQPLTPKFAASRPVSLPDASPFPRPLSFPSESWPAPPLALLQDAHSRPEVAAQINKQPGGAPDRFARWIVSTTVAHYEGSYVNGLYDGQGTGVFKCGQRYTGQWSQGLMHGQGTLTFTDGCSYTGSMLHQAVTGRGAFLWSDGARYEGEVLDGQRHGQGVFIDISDPAAPCMYEGQWDHGLRHGQGKLIYDNAGTHYYEGQWHEGARHGYGLLRYASGNLYEGEWVWDRKVGQGTMSWFSSNQKYTGQWLNDKPHGVGEYTWLDLPVAGLAGQAQTTTLSARGTSVTASSASASRGGPLLTHFQHHNRYVGDWVQGVREGEGVMFFSNGSQYSGAWHNDRKHGEAKFVFPNGSVYEGPFLNDQMADASKWNNPYSGVAEQMGALSLSAQQPNGAPAIASPKASKKLTPSATTVKDVGMFDLPLDDLLQAHTDELGLRAGAPATQAYVTSQKEQLANLLLRYNTELLDVYRFYAQASVDLAQPAWEPASLPFTPLSPTSAPANLVHPSAQASAVSSRLNLAQLWLLISDLGIMGHPSLPDCLSLAAIDRLVFRRMLLGRAPEAHANRLLLPDLHSIHDPRQILLVRDFNEALIRLADELFRTPPSPTDAAETTEEERELAKEEAELAKQIEQEEADASGVPLDDSASAEYVPPTTLYARAHQAFNQILLGSAAAPAASDLSLPLHALTALTSPTSNRSLGSGGAASQRGAITMNASSALVATTTARGGYGSTIAFAGLPVGSAVAPRNTIVNRFKRFLVEFLLPRAQRRSKHAFSQGTGSQLASPGRGGAGWESGSFGGNAIGLTLAQQPLYRLPMLVQLAKLYEKDIYTRIFLPYSTQQPNLIAAAGVASSAVAASADPALKLLQPLSDRTIRLSAVLRLLQVRAPAPAPSVLSSYFTFYHCLDLLFGLQCHRDERLWEGMEVELLFEELVDLLVKMALWRGKVLANAAVSIGQERAQLERIRAERREKAEVEAKAKADAAAAAQAEIDAAAAAAAAAAEPEKGKAGSKASGAKAAPSKPSSAASKDKAAAAAAAAAGSKSSSSTARAGSAKKTSSGSATPASGGKASAAPTPRSSAGGSGKKKDAKSGSGSKPGSAKGSSSSSSSHKKRASVSASVASPMSPSNGSSALSPHASQPNSSRLALLGGSTGNLRKSAASHQSSSDVISELDRLSLAEGGGASSQLFGGVECDTSGWAGDVEHFLCTLLQKPLPAAGVHTSFPADLNEHGMESVL